jgi:hypothetical protein
VPGEKDGGGNGRAARFDDRHEASPGSMIRLERRRKNRFGCIGTPSRRRVFTCSSKKASVKSRSSSAQRIFRPDRSAIRILRRLFHHRFTVVLCVQLLAITSEALKTEDILSAPYSPDSDR